MFRRWLRRALVGGALFGLAVVILHPAIRWLVLLQVQMLGRLPSWGGTPSLYGVLGSDYDWAYHQRLGEIAAKHPNDYEIQVGARLLSRTSFAALPQQFRSNPAAYAHAITCENRMVRESHEMPADVLLSLFGREYQTLVVAEILGIVPPMFHIFSVHARGGPIIAWHSHLFYTLRTRTPLFISFAEQAVRLPSERMWQDILYLSAQGESLAPDNAFFTFFRFLSLAELGRDEEATHALMTAAGKVAWEDYESVALRGVWRVLQQWWVKPPAFALYIALAPLQDSLMSYYGILHRASVRALGLVRQCETSGRIAESLDLRLAMTRCGSIVMQNARSESMQDAGAVLVWHSAAELTLSADLLEKRMDELLPKHLERLRRLGREREASWWQQIFRVAVHSLSTSSRISAFPEERIRRQLSHLSRLWRRNLTFLLVLALLLPTWAVCTIVAHTRYRREPVVLVLMLLLTILLIVVLSYSEAAQTLWALLSLEKYWYTPDTTPPPQSGSYLSAVLQWIQKLFPRVSAGDASEYRPFATAFALTGVLLVFVFTGALWASIRGYTAAESCVQGPRYAGPPIIAMMVLLYTFSIWQTAQLEAKTSAPMEVLLREGTQSVHEDWVQDTLRPLFFWRYEMEED